ncbi:MAG: leucine-rich repeat protein [Oscillibacter sp.]|nr:leucine-rich repeat protein [Oscillibacter sp.]
MRKNWTALLLALALCLSLAVPARAAAPDKDGFIVDAEGVLTKYSGSGGHIVLPAGVKKVGYGAFDRCSTLSSVVIPEGVTYIGTNAFRNCVGLTKVSFPSTLEEIDSGAFGGCISLTALDLPDSVTSLGEQGSNFFGCTNLKQVTVGRGLTKLPYAAFGKCTSLLSAVVPGNVTTFSWSFLDCPNLTIHGVSGSRAEAYAAESGIPFAADLGASATVSRFTDVPAASPYAAAILWAVENEVTTGKETTRFGPDEVCTRGQFLTFLWRANGAPRSNEATHFTDPIPEDYLMAARWAYGMGLVSGSTLGAGEPCTRSMAITWLWQLAGNPAAFPSSFQDLPRKSDLFMAASWAVTTNVADKLGDNFSPNRVCTRGEALTYLYRAVKKTLLIESPSAGRRFFLLEPDSPGPPIRRSAHGLRGVFRLPHSHRS